MAYWSKFALRLHDDKSNCQLPITANYCICSFSVFDRSIYSNITALLNCSLVIISNLMAVFYETKNSADNATSSTNSEETTGSI